MKTSELKKDSPDFAADALAALVTPKDTLTAIIKLAEIMAQQAREVAELEAKLKDAKAAHRRTETEDLPEMMREIGLSSFRLDDGSTITVEPDVDCYISEARRAEAHGWLVENGFGGLIKTQVITAFGRGEVESALAYAKQATEAWPEHPAELKDAVHPQTLKAFVKEQMAKGQPVPEDLFGVRPFNRAKLKR